MITVSAFTGEIPRIIPRLLPDSAAQIALNTRLNNGAITPLRAPQDVETLAADALTIYRHNGIWLGWNAVVDAAPGPVASDRLYFTGDGVPKMRVAGTTYPLALPGPTVKLTTALVAGTPDPDLDSTVLYTYTFVTDFGEESEPAPISDPLTWSPGLDIELSGFQAAPGGRAITKQRIYRSQTSLQGVTTLYFIAERAASAANFIDVSGANAIVEPLPSTGYNPPPDGLTGLTSLPNGMMAGFVGKKLYFSEPYQPHAWPEAYSRTVDFDIVGLGAFGSTIAVMTTGNPYILQGTTPETMAMERVEESLPCLSARGIVDLGYLVAYPSPEGLVTISSQGCVLRTRSLFTKELWEALNPASFRASRYDGRYIASYEVSGVRRTLQIDMTGEQPFVLRADAAPTALFSDIGTGELFILTGTRTIQSWDSPTAPLLSQTWRSRLNYLPAPVNFGAVRIDGKRIVGQSFACRIIADGITRRTIGEINKVKRLPGGFLAEQWEIEITGMVEVSAIRLASNPGELAGA